MHELAEVEVGRKSKLFSLNRDAGEGHHNHLRISVRATWLPFCNISMRLAWI